MPFGAIGGSSPYYPAVDDSPVGLGAIQNLTPNGSRSPETPYPLNKIADLSYIRKCVSLIAAALNPVRAYWTVKRQEEVNGYRVFFPLAERHPISRLFDNPSPLIDASTFWDAFIYTYCLEGNVILIPDFRRGRRIVGLWMGLGSPTLKKLGEWQVVLWPNSRLPGWPYAPLLSLSRNSIIPLSWPGSSWTVTGEIGPSPIRQYCTLGSDALLRGMASFRRSMYQHSYNGPMLTIGGHAIRDEKALSNTIKQNQLSFKSALDKSSIPILSPGIGVEWPGATATNLDPNMKAILDFSGEDIARAFGLPVELVAPKGSRRPHREVQDDAWRSCYQIHASRFASALTQALLTREEREDGLQVVIDVPRGGTPYEQLEYAEKSFAQGGLTRRDEERIKLGMPPLNGEEGRMLIVPRGTAAAEKPGETQEPNEPNEPKEPEENTD